MQLIKLVLLFFLPYLSCGQGLSFALEQIDGQVMIDKGLTGNGIRIGIIDGGFLNADEHASLLPHFEENRVKYYRDFVTPDLAPYSGSRVLDDLHGTKVWQMIGGVDPEKNIQLGLATNAEYFLARTDHAAYEKRVEEEYLIEALNEMIKLGVQIVNISLGYTNGYTNKSENYTPEQMDGQSSWITRSIDSIMAIHNVLIIVSAGNDGNGSWTTLSAPADSKNVLTVGATKFGRQEEMNYSAKGSESLEYVKPDISCFSTTGTSYSAPVITGLVACMLEFDSTLIPSAIKDLLISSSTHYPYPNNHIGYGIPSAKKLIDLLEKRRTDTLSTVHTDKNVVKLSINQEVSHDKKKNRTIVYHKIGWRVIKKEIIRTKKDLVRIHRHKGSEQSTVNLNDRIVEILWKNQ